MFKKLRWKLTATYIGLVILSMLVMGAYLINSLENYFYDSLKNRLETKALLSSRLIENSFDDWDTQHMEALADKISSDLGARVTIIDMGGNVLGDSQENASIMENHLNRPEVRKAITDGTGMATRYSNTINSHMMYVAVKIYRDQEPAGFVRLALPLTETRQAFFNLWSAVLVAILLAVLITAPVSLGLGKKVTEPVERLIEFTRYVSQGEFGRQVRVKSNDEIGELAATLNHMAATINEKVKQVSEGKNQLEAVLTSMISGVIFVDHKGQINLINPAAEKFLSFMGTGLPYDVSIKNPELANAIKNVLASGQVAEQEIRINMEETYLKVIISPILNQSGSLSGIVAVLHDITEIKKLERMRREFVANVSHELKTPVTAIKGFTETLLDGAMNDRETSCEFIEIIDGETERLSRLIQDLLELSKIESKKVKLNNEQVDISKIVQNIVIKMHGQIEKAGLTIYLDLPVKPVTAALDLDMIGQVMLNLVDNAVKYTPAGGMIKIAVAEKNEDIIVSVLDNGFGIPSDDLNRVFERFYRVDKARSRDAGGTGLGLSIVKHIIEDVYGGKVGVKSKPGSGSEFYFTLPRPYGTGTG